MKLFRTLAFLLCLFGLGAAAQAQTTPTCYSSQQPLMVNYAGGGSISITYQVCFNNPNDYTSFTYNGAVTYNNVNWGDVSINGTMNIVMNYSATGISSIAFSGGPLNYVVNGAPYVVSFNNLTFNFGQGFQVTGASGTVTINGTSYGGDPMYWG